MCQTTLDEGIKATKHVPSIRSKIDSLQELITGQRIQRIGNPCDDNFYLCIVLSDSWFEQLYFNLRLNWWNTQLFVKLKIPEDIALQINFIASVSKEDKLTIGGPESSLLWLFSLEMVQMRNCCLEPANYHFTTCVMVQLDTLHCVRSNSNLKPLVITSAEATYANYWSISLLVVTMDGCPMYWTRVLGAITWKVIRCAILTGASIKIVLFSKQYLQFLTFKTRHTRAVQFSKPSMRYSSYPFDVQFSANRLRIIGIPVNVLGALWPLQRNHACSLGSKW